MVRVSKKWSLPHFILTENHLTQVERINQLIKKELDIDVTTCCCVYNDLDTDRNLVNRVFVLENHRHKWKLPTNFRWVNRDELSKLVLVVPEHRQGIKAWFDEVGDSKISLQRVPWARSGWFKEAEVWIGDRLNHLGITAIVPLEQLRSWATSCVMRVNTTSGNIYFKATPDTLANEALFTQCLAEKYPENFPKVLAVEPEKHWCLMQDFGGTLLSEITDIVAWEKALRQFAQIQIDAAQSCETWLNLGWQDRRIDKLPSEIELLLADTEALLAGEFIIIEESDVDVLRSLIPEFRGMCEALASYKVPQTLVHGDFWAKNVAVTENNYIYFDLPTSAIAHPFFDIVNFLYIEKYVPDLPDVRTRLRNVYLEEWTIYEPMERLLEAFELSKNLGMLYQAITYYKIVSNLAPLAKWEIEVAVPLCLEKLLNYRASYSRT